MEKKRGLKPDLKSSIADFVTDQEYYLEIERQEEEGITQFHRTNNTAKALETLGVCIRKLEVVEIICSSYGKYLTEFTKRTKRDPGNKINKYKFDHGDVVGLFQYSDKINKEPLYEGIVSQFNSRKIIVIFDNEIEVDKLPSNICLVQLVNQVTYERIKTGGERGKEMNFHEKTFPLVNTLFEIFEPTYNESEERMKYGNEGTYSNTCGNPSQQAAVKFAGTVNEIGLIHGPPGTGKTTTIVEVIIQLVKLGNKILVVAPSNIAVDNIGEKLLNFKGKSKVDFELSRIGHPARLLDSVIDICLDSKIEKVRAGSSSAASNVILRKQGENGINCHIEIKKKKSELKSKLSQLRYDIKGTYKNTVFDTYKNSNVILATCVGSGEKYLQLAVSNDNPFDYIIIDECAQATECLCWIPILQGKKLIGAGDHGQLPPTIKSKKSEYVLGYTLFDRMIQIYGDKCCRMLNIQYRMNEKIMNFSSKQLYEGKGEADELVKNHTVKDGVLSRGINFDEIDDSYDIIEKPALLINTAGLNLFETKDADSLSTFNIGEVEICKIFVNYLLNNLKLTHDDIGVITPYSAQVSALREKISIEDYPGIEISTVDGFQGREKEVIILTLVRSNQTHTVGFGSDKRRLNVAITRPRRMLVGICDIETIEKDEFLNNGSQYMELNATNLDIIGGIMDYDMYLEIESKCVEIKKKEDKANEEKGDYNSGNKERGRKKCKDKGGDNGNFYEKKKGGGKKKKK